MHRLLTPKQNTMKKIYYLILAGAALGACSTPKYTASFNSYESYAAKPQTNPAPVVADKPVQEVALASNSSTPLVVAEEAGTSTAVKKTYVQMNKAERKALRNHLRSEIKTYVKEQKKHTLESEKTNRGMDNDLKLAAIFGAVGIVALIISGNVFYILGGIALIIGVVFFVKWLVRQ